MEFYQDKKRKEAYQGPFSYDKISHAMLNYKNEKIAYIQLSHPMDAFDEDRNEFGQKIVELLNKNS